MSETLEPVVTTVDQQKLAEQLLAPFPRPHRPREGTMGMRWKQALSAFAITFHGRITPTGN
jgi:hypothetical protein